MENKDLKNFIRNDKFLNKIVTAEEAASWIRDGMNLGMSGFTLFGEPKEFPLALSKRGEKEKFKINLYTGASLGPVADQSMAEVDIIRLRVPYQANKVMRNKINNGEILYIDQHLSHMGEEIRKGTLGKIDYAIIEAAAITEDGMIIPTGSVGNSQIFVEKAEHVIVELNTKASPEYEGLHDIFTIPKQGQRPEIPMYHVGDRIGSTGIFVHPDKVRGIILSEQLDTPSPLFEPNEETQQLEIGRASCREREERSLASTCSSEQKPKPGRTA